MSIGTGGIRAGESVRFTDSPALKKDESQEEGGGLAFGE
jgi:hypothetical protein